MLRISSILSICGGSILLINGICDIIEAIVDIEEKLMNRIVQKKILKVEFMKKIKHILLHQNIPQVRHNVEDKNVEE